MALVASAAAYHRRRPHRPRCWSRSAGRRGSFGAAARGAAGGFAARLERRPGAAYPSCGACTGSTPPPPRPPLRGPPRCAARDRGCGRPPPPPPPAVCREEPPGGWPVLDPAAVTPDLAPYQDYRGLGIPDGAAGPASGSPTWSTSGAGRAELDDRGLPAPVLTPGGLAEAFKVEEHGTAVLGILGADDDASGITGLAQAAQIEPLSPFFQRPPGLRPAGRRSGRPRLRPGDVLLIEQQTQVGTPPSTVFAPIEAIPAMRDLIRAVVDAGVVVVEPAGNGDRDLASFNSPGLRGRATRRQRRAGGGRRRLALGGHRPRPHDRPDANYGARVDLQGFGAGRPGPGYGEASGRRARDRAYTSCFDGTSSASATVAGAVAALQGLARATPGAPLAPAAVRAALVATGLPQPDWWTPIGPRPRCPPPPPWSGPWRRRRPVRTRPAPPPPPCRRRPAGSRGGGTGGAPRRARRERPPRPARGRPHITLRGLAPRAIVFAGGRRVRVVRDRVVRRSSGRDDSSSSSARPPPAGAPTSWPATGWSCRRGGPSGYAPLRARVTSPACRLLP